MCEINSMLSSHFHFKRQPASQANESEAEAEVKAASSLARIKPQNRRNNKGPAGYVAKRSS